MANPTSEQVADRLRTHLGELKDVDKAVELHPRTWEPHLQPFAVATAALRDLCETPRGSLPEVAWIRRSQLVDRARGLVDLARQGDDLVRLFVWVQLWGSGTSNGRGPRHSAAALASPTLRATLQHTAELVWAGEPGEAYAAFARSKVAGVGPPFFTKYLWAIGAGRNLRPRPLIWDSRASASLWYGPGGRSAKREASPMSLGWDSREAAGGASDWGARYTAYLLAAHDWADQLGIEPHEVEWLLFARKGRIWVESRAVV